MGTIYIGTGGQSIFEDSQNNTLEDPQFEDHKMEKQHLAVVPAVTGAPFKTIITSRSMTQGT